MKTNLWIHRKTGAGTMEYIVIIGLILAVFLFAFWANIAGALESKLKEAGIQVKIPRKKTKNDTPGEEITPQESGGSMLSGPAKISYSPNPVSSGTPTGK